MASRASNEMILEQLRNGTATFELVASPVSPISSTKFQRLSSSFLRERSHRFFARIGSSLGGEDSPALKKVEHYKVQKVTGDGRCLFRALVKGMAMNKGINQNSREERDNAVHPTTVGMKWSALYKVRESTKEKLRIWIRSHSMTRRKYNSFRVGADELRMAVKEAICESDKERRQYETALVAITVDESLKRYCQRIEQPDFWGGESELLVLSKLCRQPIIVYIPEHEHTRGGRGFIPIAEYGEEFGKTSKKGNPRKAVRLLYSGKNHYDLLV